MTAAAPAIGLQSIADEVVAALEAGSLDLPTLPDMALRIRDLIDDPDTSAERVVHLLSGDPVISAEIIRAANSAAHASGSPVSNLQGAIARLGYRMLRSMVMSITMTRLFKGGNPRLDRQLKELWAHSREVAANSYVLARRQRQLNVEQALLAGLVHAIGALPLYIYADRHHPGLDPAALEGLIRRFAAPVGARMLRSWNFPAELVDVVAGHEDLQRTNDSGVADYTDVVTVANLQMPVTGRFVAWEKVGAAARLGLSSEECRDFLASHADKLAAVKRMLGVDAPSRDAAPALAPASAAPADVAPDAASAYRYVQEGKPGVLSFLSGLFKRSGPQ